MSTTRIVHLARFFNFFTIFTLLLSMSFGGVRKAASQTYPPSITVEPDHDWVQALDWVVGSNILLTIDDDTDPGNGFLYQEAKMVTEYAVWGPTRPIVMFFLGSTFDIQVGHYITMTDGSTPKSLWVEEVHFDNLDEANDTATGRGPANRNASVQVWTDTTQYSFLLTISASGTWFADFASQGDNLESVQNAHIQVYDNDWDVTMAHRLPPPPPPPATPNITAHYDNWIGGESWPLGSTVFIEVDDPANGQGVDFSGSMVVEPDPDIPDATWIQFDLGAFELAGGQLITMWDDPYTFTKTLTVSDLAVTTINMNDDIISGTTDSTDPIYVVARCNNIRAVRLITPANGLWSADFSEVGSGPSPDEQVIHDLTYGCSGPVHQEDTDHDSTTFHWRSGHRPVVVANLTSNQVYSETWPLGSNVTLTIDDASNGLGVDYTDYGIVGEAPWGNPNFTWVEFFPDNLELEPGDTVTLSGNTITKELVVKPLVITGFDMDLNTVAGTAVPGDEVAVFAKGGRRDAIADANGIWEVNFSIAGSQPFEQVIVDLTPGTNFGADLFDLDGDYTEAELRIPNPTIGASVRGNHIFSEGWSLGDVVTLTIDDPSNGQGVDHQEDMIAEPAPWDPNQTHLDFYPQGFQIQPGQTIELTNGEITKNLIVTFIEITSVDVQTDIVTGLSDPTTDVFVYLEGEPFGFSQRGVTSGPDGTWSVDFSVPDPNDSNNMAVDITPGINVGVIRPDEDGDLTEDNIVIEPPQCQPGNSVSGAVFEHDGTTPIPNITIQFEDFNTGLILFTSSTNQYGQFGCSLLDGDYRILALDNNSYYSREYFNEARDTNATLLEVIGGAQFANINFTLSPLPIMEHLTFNLTNPLLQDLSVRQAVFHGTNRQEILSEAFLPYNLFGMVSNSIVPPEHWVAAPTSELTLYSFNPTQAGAILDAADWINRDADIYRENASGVELAFTFKTTNAPVRVESAELFRQQMEQIGIRINVEHIQPGALFDTGGVLDQGNFDISEFAWGGSYDDETYLEGYVTGNIYNWSGYSNPTFDAAMASATAASTDAERLPNLYEAQAILTKDLPIIPLFTRQSVAPVTTTTGTNVTVSPETYLDITFGEVTDGGVTTVLPTNINPNDLPPNFQLLGQVYDVGTSASFTSAQVCFSYDDTGLTQTQEDAVRLLHLENGSWLDVTDEGYPDTGNNTVCGTVTSFSPFIVAYSDDSTPPTITWIGDIEDGDTFYFGYVPPAPTCTATDSGSGVDGDCTMAGYGDFVNSHTLVATAQDNAGNIATESRTYTVLSWTLSGFFHPVDMNGVYNVVKNGSTVPLKFEVFAGSTELTEVTQIKSLSYAETTCNSNAVTDEIELTATGGTSLRYDEASGQFIYNWKTPRLAGKCYRVTMTTIDGSTLLAYFKLK